MICEMFFVKKGSNSFRERNNSTMRKVLFTLSECECSDNAMPKAMFRQEEQECSALQEYLNKR